jgi:cell division protein FtsB
LNLDKTGIKIIRWIKNHPVTVLVATAVIWLLFFDRDSIMYQFKINREIRNLQHENDTLRKQIELNKNLIRRMNDLNYLEQYAREELLLRKENEDIYLIDTTRYENER